MLVFYEKFVVDGETYVAFGEHEMSMPLYVERRPGLHVRKGELNWPSWFKFIYPDEFEVLASGRMDIEKFKEKFGVFMSQEDFDYAMYDIFEQMDNEAAG